MRVCVRVRACMGVLVRVCMGVLVRVCVIELQTFIIYWQKAENREC